MSNLLADFEGTTGSDGLDDLRDGYKALAWSGVTVIGRHFMRSNFHDGYGFNTVLQGKVEAYADPTAHAVEIAAPYGLFTLKSGIFASAYNEGETVTFSAYRDGTLVGVKSVILNQDARTVHFGDNFKHVDTIHIDADGGTDTNPGDGLEGETIVFDNLAVAVSQVREPPHAAALAHALNIAQPFGPVHDTGWDLF